MKKKQILNTRGVCMYICKVSRNSSIRTISNLYIFIDNIQIEQIITGNSIKIITWTDFFFQETLYIGGRHNIKPKHNAYFYKFQCNWTIVRHKVHSSDASLFERAESFWPKVLYRLLCLLLIYFRVAFWKSRDKTNVGSIFFLLMWQVTDK